MFVIKSLRKKERLQTEHPKSHPANSRIKATLRLPVLKANVVRQIATNKNRYLFFNMVFQLGKSSNKFCGFAKVYIL